MLFLFSSAATATDTRTLEDQIYAAEQALSRGACSNGDNVSKYLLKAFPDEPSVHLLRAKVGHCYGAPPDRIYPYYQQYLKHGGTLKKVVGKMSALERHLFSLEVRAIGPKKWADFDLDQITGVSLLPIVVPDREEPVSYELVRGDDNRYRVKGVVPGRYKLQVDSDNILVPAASVRVTAKKGKKQTIDMRLESLVAEFPTMLKDNRCEQVKSQAQGFIRADGRLVGVRKLHIEALACLERQGDVASRTELHGFYNAYVDRGGEASTIPYTAVTLRADLPDKVFGDLEARRGDTLIERGASGARFLLLPDDYMVNVEVRDPLYVTTTLKVTVGRGTKERTVPLASLASSTLEIPKFDPSIALVLQSPTGHSLQLDRDQRKLQVAAGPASAEATIAGVPKPVSYEFMIDPKNSELPLPSALVINSGTSQQSDVRVPGKAEKKPRILRVPIPGAEDGATFEVSTDVQLDPGTVRTIEVTPERFLPVADHQKWMDLQGKSMRGTFWAFTGGALAVGLGTGGAYQLMQAISLGNEASAITSASQGTEYQRLTDAADRTGYTGIVMIGGSVLTGAATALLFRKSVSLARQLKEAREQFQSSSRQPVSLEAE